MKWFVSPHSKESACYRNLETFYPFEGREALFKTILILKVFL